MRLFSESDLIELRGRFPDRDVDRVAVDVTSRNARSPLRNPIAMLRRWLEIAESKNTYRICESQADDAPRDMFRADGSWDERGFGDHETHRFIDILVTARRRDYPPSRVALRIAREPGAERAFPNAGTWVRMEDWALVPCSTSAEQCVKNAPGGSWRGVPQLWGVGG